MIKLESLLFTKLKKIINEEKDYSDLQDILGDFQYIYGNYYFEYALEKHRYDGDNS